jgi:rhodanese-related sulfurtransferase
MKRLALTILLTVLALPASAGEVQSISPDQLLTEMKADRQQILLLDVRTPKEYMEGHVPGAVNVPLDQLESRVGEVKARGAEKVVVYCESGRRAGEAEAMLESAGVSNVYDLDGHMKGWREDKRPTRRRMPKKDAKSDAKPDAKQNAMPQAKP